MSGYKQCHFIHFEIGRIRLNCKVCIDPLVHAKSHGGKSRDEIIY